MSIAVFDIGGSAVKYGMWNDGKLTNNSKFETPNSLDQMIDQLKAVITSYDNKIDGVAFSSPGVVNVEKRRIEGLSAVPYLHDCPIFDQLEEALGLPITIENDANCAGICEVEMGAGHGAKSAVFIILGTGVGGSLFIDGKIYKGSHLFAGELGLIQNTNKHHLSYNGTAVNVSSRFSQEKGRTITGKELFQLKEAKNTDAIQALDGMYANLAEAIYNIQVIFDPQVVIFGGAISERPELVTEVQKKYRELSSKFEVSELEPEFKACQFKNNANLIGAALNYENLKN